MGYLDIVRYLVKELGANVNQTTLSGATALHNAARQGSLDVVQCLVKELGAAQALINGATPLYVAAHHGFLYVVQCLVKELDADVNAALLIAAQNANLDVLRCLANDFGADVNKARKDGATPLYIAVQMANLDVLRCLVSEHGADVNQANGEGETPLMRAAILNNQTIVKKLVHKGANVRAVTKSGSTAVSMLKASGATAEQVAYLEVREYCANPDCDGGGMKRCAVCKETRYCGKPCQVMNWRVHQMDCRPPIKEENEGC
jgi:ankyrin repeat protein